ncbi:MAG: AAA family ATPase, partial [Pseudomonadota bacterium]
MILEGNERSHGAELARHLSNLLDNDHVELHAIDGFVAQDLAGAFAESAAISEATQCTKHLFSLSLNPPPGVSVSVEAFEAAISVIEERLGLAGQPRAIVFHEKNGRRHAHCVWSRIDVRRMRAINLPHYKRKLAEVSRELYRTHDWTMPEGFRDTSKRDRANYGRQEAGQAKRSDRAAAALKRMFSRLWETSDSRAAFEAALQAERFRLARGDRRGFVAVDEAGEVWSLSRWCGVTPKALRARLGSEDDLPTVEDLVGRAVRREEDPPNASAGEMERRRARLVARQRSERAALLTAQASRRTASSRARRPKGLRAVFALFGSGRRAAIKAAEADVLAAEKRDRAEQQRLIETHLSERRALVRDATRAGVARAFEDAGRPDARQTLRLKPDDGSLTKAQLLEDPALVVAHLSKTKARFTRADLLRELAGYVDDPLWLSGAVETALASPNVVREADGPPPEFTTLDFRTAEEDLARSARDMARRRGSGVSGDHRSAAVQGQNAEMRRAFGGRLSHEQLAAIEHVLGDNDFACVVGLAGAGKSTLLATAADAWRRQGLTVHGAALAGKAADGLVEAAGIQSRTLASLEMAWAHGLEPIAPGDVLVVDEAGMIGTRQLARIAANMAELGAKLVLVGDPEQLQPIEAGTPFRDLVEAHGAARLTEIHRQKDDWQRRATMMLAEGETAEAVDLHERRGGVRRGPDAIDALAETYALDAISPGGGSQLALAHSRRDVHALNQAIRNAIRPEDAPPDVLIETETGPRGFAPGDRLVFTRNDRDVGVKNGM